MTEQTKDPLTALAQQYATKYTNRHTPGETAFAFGPEAWQEFCKAVQAHSLSQQKRIPSDSDALQAELDELKLFVKGDYESAVLAIKKRIAMKEPK